MEQIKCPNCGAEMNIKKNAKKHFHTFCEWTDENPDGWYTEYIYSCKPCGIKAREESDSSGTDWTIPYTLQPTEKQSNAIDFINGVLHMGAEPLTKRQAWKIIHDNIDEAKKQHERDFSEWCEDNADWLPEYF